MRIIHFMVFVHMWNLQLTYNSILTFYQTIWIVHNINNLTKLNTCLTSSCILLQGFLGHEGEKGEKGFSGFDGAPGLVGDVGRVGDDGFHGYRGPPGLPGHVGFIGMPGPTGEKGEPGFPGDFGEPGQLLRLQNASESVYKNIQ